MVHYNDENFVSPRTLPWLYSLIVENDIEVTIRRCREFPDMVDVTLSKTGVFVGSQKVTYETTIRDFIVTKHPFLNQHNAVGSVVRQVGKWVEENARSSSEIDEIVKRFSNQ